MKINFTYILIPFVAFVIIFSIGCTSHKEKVEDLIAQKKLKDAKLLIAEYAKGDELDKDLFKLSQQVDYLLIEDTCNSLIEDGNYNGAIKLIDSSLFNFQNSPTYSKSIKGLLTKISFQGANKYQKDGEIFSAYNCLIPLLLSKIDINQEERELVNEITKSILSGIWKANSIKWKIPALMKIRALNSKTFYGGIKYGEDFYYSSKLSNCNFDIVDMVATYFVEGPNRIEGTNYSYAQTFTDNPEELKGKFINGIIKTTLTLRTNHNIYLSGGPDTDRFVITRYVVDTCYFQKIK